MRWRKALIVLFCVVAAVAATEASAGTTPTPILTGAYTVPSSKGFGQVKPTTIYLGGDPTGLVCRIRWASWGGQFAVGTGTGYYIGPHQVVAAGHQAPAVVVLYHLGSWRGRPAYTKFQWYFPQNGSTYGGVSRCSV
jgi:hypothetical protein